MQRSRLCLIRVILKDISKILAILEMCKTDGEGTDEEVVLFAASADDAKGGLVLKDVVDLVGRVGPVLGMVEDDVHDVSWQLLAFREEDSSDENVDGSRVV